MNVDLETRVATRKQELVSELHEHKRNSSRGQAASSISHLQDRLHELAHILKSGVTKGWNDISPATSAQLDAWIAR